MKKIKKATFPLQAHTGIYLGTYHSGIYIGTYHSGIYSKTRL